MAQRKINGLQKPHNLNKSKTHEKSKGYANVQENSEALPYYVCSSICKAAKICEKSEK